MSWLNNTLNFTSNVVTLGGSSKVKTAKQEYDLVFEQYEPLFKKADAIKTQTDSVLNQIGVRIKSINTILTQVQTTLDRECKIENGYGTSPLSSSIESIQSFNTSFNAASTVGFGGVVGGSTAVGAWALVSTVGSASTGASIAGLSGVAASNATLAWFGGGSLAAGGAGMTGGMAVLGGIVAVPMLYFASRGAYKKAQKISEETEKLDAEIVKLKAMLPIAKSELDKAKKCAAYIDEISSRYEMVAVQILNDITKMESYKFKWYKIQTWFSDKYDPEAKARLTEVLALETEQYLSLLNQNKLV
ncbi:hypothetical protein AB4341_05795 [Vibrio breoganii]